MKNNEGSTGGRAPAEGTGFAADGPSDLVSDGLTAEREQELKQCADRYGIRFVTVVSDDMLDPELVANLPVEWARTNHLLPVRIDGEACVLTAKPEEVTCQDDLALLVGTELRPVLAPPDLISRSIERCYYRKDESPTAFLEDLSGAAGPEVTGASKADDLLERSQKAPVSQLINLILLEAAKRGASDVHFEPFESSLRVRYRIDGVLYEQTQPPKQMEEALVSRLKVMARMDIAEKRLPQDGMARVRVGEREIDIRVSTVPVAEGERVVLRLLNRDAAFLPLETLGMSEPVRRSVQGLISQKNGLVVVSGPTGSGKTTTLYAALGRLDASRKNILTIEDPIEYQLPDIGQIQVKPKIGLTFANGLRHVLRQDPDVVLVGEMRDMETAEIAIRASLTGHLVFTTLHTNDAPGAVVRLVDMGVEPYLLASCLKGVLAQRLVRKLCDACKTPTSLPPAFLARAQACGRQGDGAELRAWEPVGCDQCLEGYRGRTGLFELMLSDGGIQELVRSGQAGAAALRELAESRGMCGLMADGMGKVLEGATSLSEVIDVVPE